MERAEKLVIEVIEQAPEAEVDEEGLIKLAATMAGKTVEEFLADRDAKKPTLAPAGPALSVVKVEDELTREAQAAQDKSLIYECRQIYELLKKGEQDDALGKLARSLSSRTDWCICPPGGCDGKADMWDCRQNSPIAQ
jgi:ribosomal protein L12E/L44/L45/RPP1/RPP2